MKIGIIGAGFTGLSAAYQLTKKGHAVFVFEKDSLPGGLAIGYKENNWDWTVEKAYHHWFTNDSHVLSLAKEIRYPVLIRKPLTNWYVQGTVYQFASVKAALSFPLLSPFERLRQLIALGLLRMNPFWQPLEKYKTNHSMKKLMGKKTYEMLWEPLMKNKFGTHFEDISLAWFWARIKKRTEALAYPAEGFLEFSKKLAKAIENKNGIFYFNTEVLLLKNNNNHVEIHFQKNGKKKKLEFDKVIVTLPSFYFLKIAPHLPHAYKTQLMKLKGIGASNMILRLKKQFFTDNTYWLSIADSSSPIMAIIEHTNFIDKKHYNNEHIVYLGNYLSSDEETYSKSKEELLTLYDPFLRRINPDYKKHLIDAQLFKTPFAQPIIPTRYSRILPSLITPLSNIYLANIQQVYPWDRGTNYAVELGEKVAQLVNEK